MKRVIKTKEARAREEEEMPNETIAKKPRVEEPLSEGDKGSSDERGYESDDTVILPLSDEDGPDAHSSQKEVDDVIIID